jgi:hypothetical protein
LGRLRRAYAGCVLASNLPSRPDDERHSAKPSGGGLTGFSPKEHAHSFLSPKTAAAGVAAAVFSGNAEDPKDVAVRVLRSTTLRGPHGH